MQLVPESNEPEVLSLFRRKDLVCRKIRYADRMQWAVKDPLSLSYFHLREEEYFILRHLDGATSVDAILDAFHRAFAPVRLTREQLKTYISALHAQGLVVHRNASGRSSVDRRDRLRQRMRIASWSNPLAIRWRGIDPRKWIDALFPYVRWCFSPIALMLAVGTMLSAIILLVAKHDAVAIRLPSAGTFFSPHNLLWVALATSCIKILHEFAHALTCKRFGGQCTELGMMLLVFAPCLYCNVSDAWLMNNRWHRIAVSGAGIFMELFLAAICSFLWWFSEPGLLNTVCLNVMVVCSINTVLFNGNPLLRYDGYYVFTDLVGVPNLGMRSRDLLIDWLARIACGVRLANPRAFPERGRWGLIAYAVASLLYRCFVLVAILWFLHQVLKPVGLIALAQLLTILVVSTMVIATMRNLLSQIRQLRRHPVKWMRFSIVTMVVGVALAYIFLVPMPQRITVPAYVQPSDAVKVFVSEAGRVPREHSRPLVPGTRVIRGEPLIQLRNADIELTLAELEQRIEALRLRLDTMSVMRIRNASIGDSVLPTKELLVALESQRNDLLSRREALTLRAPIDGVILPDRWHDEESRPTSEVDRRKRWVGTPLDVRNAGCTLQRGSTYCLVGDPQHLTATMIIPQDSIDLIKAGQSVRVWLNTHPGSAIDARIREVSIAEVESAPEVLARRGELDLETTTHEGSRLATRSYQASAALDKALFDIPIRATGWAKIEVAHESLARRIGRYIAGTFRF
ncbi:MAG: hypothetical protein R3C05_21235 [Pirellulaceae bacterium]